MGSPTATPGAADLLGQFSPHCSELWPEAVWRSLTYLSLAVPVGTRWHEGESVVNCHIQEAPL